MNCPHCGVEGYEKEVGCRVCLYLEEAMNGPAAGEEMELPELNRMLEALGVQPLTDVERVSASSDEYSVENGEIPFPATDDDIQNTNSQLEPEFIQTQPVEDGNNKERLAAARYSAGGLRIVRQIISDVSHQAITIAGTVFRALLKKHQNRKSETTRSEELATTMKEELAAQDESEAIEQFTATEEVEETGDSERWTQAVEADLPVALRQHEDVPETEVLSENEEPSIPDKRSKDSWLFWVGVPALVILLAVSMFLLVLSWRRQLMEPDEPVSSIRPDAYIPWTPETEPVPGWSVTITED